MIKFGLQNISVNTDSEEIYQCIINEMQKIDNGEAFQIKDCDQDNPFIDKSPSNDSVDTFNEASPLTTQIEQHTLTVFSNLQEFDVKHFISFLESLKKLSNGFKTKFSIKIEYFLHFLRSYFEKIKPDAEPVESLITLLERKGNKRVIETMAHKFYKVLFFQQIPVTVSFFEISTIYNFSRTYLIEDKFLQLIKKIILRSFMLSILNRYQSQHTYPTTKTFLSKFSEIFEACINALNGSISEIGVKESDISKIIFIMMSFVLEKSRSIFLSQYSYKELFYCALRSIYQGHIFAKKLECFIITKLRWRLICDEEDYTIDKIYQTIFKYEFRKIIGSLQDKARYLPKHSRKSTLKLLYRLNSKVPDKNKINLITKVVHTTPNSKTVKESYTFSPLSKRIGEAMKNRESLDSKRKLKFD